MCLSDFLSQTDVILIAYLRRYMERQLRDNVGFQGTPLRLLWRGKPEREKGTVRVRPDSNSRDKKPSGGSKDK